MTFRPVPKPESPSDTTERTFNYDSDALLEHVLGDVDYRLDVGRQGTALALSSRPSGTWDWSYVGELKWDGRTLSGKAVPYATREALGAALRESLD